MNGSLKEAHLDAGSHAPRMGFSFHPIWDVLQGLGISNQGPAGTASADA